MKDMTEIVARFGTRYEAELAQGYLEDAGIESALVADDAGGAMVGMGFTGPRLLVRIEDAAKARAALEEAGVLEDEEASE